MHRKRKGIIIQVVGRWKCNIGQKFLEITHEKNENSDDSSGKCKQTYNKKEGKEDIDRNRKA